MAPTLGEIEDFAFAIREHSIRMVARADASHIGGVLSMADLLAVLYLDILRIRPEEPSWEERDRFILSKGHCCAGLYAALALRGFFPVSELDRYGDPESRLLNHASHSVPGVEWSTGSLGHGLGLGCGQALAARRKKKSWRVFCLLSDGELDEGSTWEAVLFAAHHRLDNLWAIIDANQIQSLGDVRDVLDLGDIRAKFLSFGWEAIEIDGHSIAEIREGFSKRWGPQPRCIIARTIKGKGVRFMENQLEWHYRSPKTQELLDRALAQLRQSYGRA